MEFRIESVKFNIDTNKIGIELYNLHEQNNCLDVLAFGMLDYKIMKCFDENLTKTIKGKLKHCYDALEWQLGYFKGRPEIYKSIEKDISTLNNSVKEIVNKISKKVSVKIYSLAKMVV